MAAAPVAALLIDYALGEPAPRVHPVVWMGHWCARAAGWTVRCATPARQCGAGALAVTLGCLVSAAVAGWAVRGVRRLPFPSDVVLEGVALATLLSARMLEAEVAAVEARVADADAGGPDGLAAARRAVGRLVSRPVVELDAAGVREAVLQSLAENASDSVVAPLWWYTVGGLPAAAAYRFVNTADAMWGYRTPEWEWRGKVAARADDVANWLPARMTAVLLAPGVPLGTVGALAAVTSSPNAGWPMAALASRLGVRLRKRGAYRINPSGRTPRAGDVAAAIRAFRAAVAVAAVAASAAAAWRRPR